MTIAAILFGSALAVVLIVPLTLLRGWAIKTLWGWFIVPVFHAPALRIPEAIGLAIVIGMFATTETTNKEKDNSLIRTVLRVASPLIAVGFGWIVKQYM